MNIIGQVVKHITLGDGIIKKYDDGKIAVVFDTKESILQFPLGFEKFLKFVNIEYQSYVEKLLAEEKIKQEDEKRKKAEQLQKKTEVIIKHSFKVGKGSRVKKDVKENVAFKCNYCDGGLTNKSIGFSAACSDEMIKYNSTCAEHPWCRDPECPCSQYFAGYISRKELDNWCEDGGFVCYESQMLRLWRAFAGFVLRGQNKGKPMKLAKVRPNSLAVLTTRFPKTKEADRIIFAVFLVDEAYEGDGKDEGFVSAAPEYRIMLSENEANELKFWTYYFNERAPETIAWSQGLQRYIDDVQSALILKKIAELKKGTEDEELAEKFYNHYCRVNGVDKEQLPKPFGALEKLV